MIDDWSQPSSPTAATFSENDTPAPVRRNSFDSPWTAEVDAADSAQNNANTTNDNDEVIVNDVPNISDWNYPPPGLVWNGNNAFRFGGGFQFTNSAFANVNPESAQLTNIDNDALKMLHSPEGGVVLLAGKMRELIMRLLMLNKPRLTEHIVDLLQGDANLDIFMSFYSRLPLATPTYTLSKKLDWNSDLEVCAMLEQSRMPRPMEPEYLQKLSYQVVMEIIVNRDIQSHVRLTETKLREIIVRMFDVFHPASAGNFYHFTRLVEYFLVHKPLRFLDLVMLPMPYQVSFPTDSHENLLAPNVQKPLIFQGLFYLHHPPVIGAFLKMLLWQSKDDLTSTRTQKARYESLQEQEFLECLLSILCAENADPEQTMGAAQFLQRLVTACTEIDHTDILFKSLEADKMLIKQCTQLLYTSSTPHFQFRCVVDVLFALGVKTNDRMFRPLCLNDINSTPGETNVKPAESVLASVSLHVVDAIKDEIGKLGELIRQYPFSGTSEQALGPIMLNAHTVAHPFSRNRLALVELFVETLKRSLLDYSILDDLPGLIFLDMADWFFEYRYNNLYHNLYYRMITIIIRSNHRSCIKKVLIKPRLVQRMITHFESTDSTGCRGHIIMILNFIRLTSDIHRSDDYFAQFLASMSEWRAFLPILLEETWRQVGTDTVVPSIAPRSSMAVLLPALIKHIPPAPTAPVHPSSEQQSYTIAGIHLGSEYARRLGFTEAITLDMSEQESIAKKRKKKKKKKDKRVSSDGACVDNHQSLEHDEDQDDEDCFVDELIVPLTDTTICDK